MLLLSQLFALLLSCATN